MRMLILVAALLAVPAQAEDLQPLLADAGFWQGVGIQQGGQHWSMQVKLGPEVALIDYPTLECSGEWKYLKQNPTSLSAIEDITNGDNVCVTGGLIRLEVLDDDMLSYTWLDAKGKPAAMAVLIPGVLQPDLYDALLDLTRETMDTAALEQPGAGVSGATDL